MTTCHSRPCHIFPQLPAWSQAQTFRLRGFAEDKITTRSIFFCSNMWHPAICPSVTKPVNREHNLQMEVPMEKNMNAGMFHCHVWLPAGRWVIGYWKLSAFLCMKIAILESTPLAKAQSGMPMRAQNRRSFVVCNHHQPSIFVANNVWDCYIHIYIYTHT